MPKLVEIRSIRFVPPEDVRSTDEVIEDASMADAWANHIVLIRDAWRASGSEKNAETMDAYTRTETRTVCVKRRTWPEVN